MICHIRFPVKNTFIHFDISAELDALPQSRHERCLRRWCTDPADGYNSFKLEGEASAFEALSSDAASTADIATEVRWQLMGPSNVKEMASLFVFPFHSCSFSAWREWKWKGVGTGMEWREREWNGN